MTESASSQCCACHTPVPAGSRFCAQCGTPVPSSAAVAPTGSAPAGPTQIRPPNPPPEIPGSIVDGRYEILARLGGGGFGEVFRVRDTLLGREFALKTLHPHLALNPDVRLRFIREARVLMDLQHPNLCPTRHMGEWRGMIYLVMDLVPGRTLSSVLLENRALPGRTVVALGLQVLRALDYAHGKGVMHRDLKPSNLIVEVAETGKWEVKLLDFGVAKVLDQTKLGSEGDWRSLATGGPVGTWPYMSPEQIGRVQGREGADSGIDFRSDLYSLGVLLYESATGRLPFVADQVLELIRKVQTDPPPPFVTHGVREDLPGLERLILRALAKRPEERFGSAAEMARELETLVAGEPTRVPASPPVRSTAGPAAAAPGLRPSAVPPIPSYAPAAAATVMRPSTAAPAVPVPPEPPAPRARKGLPVVAATCVFALLAGVAGTQIWLRRQMKPAPGTGFTVAVAVERGGQVEVFPEQERYEPASEVLLTPKPEAGWVFDSWSDGERANPRKLVVPRRNMELSARFRSAKHTLTVEAVPADSGTVTHSGATEVEEESKVLLAATAHDGWVFSGWSDGKKDNPRTFVVPAEDRRLAAHFTLVKPEPEATPDPGGTPDPVGSPDPGGNPEAGKSSDPGGRPDPLVTHETPVRHRVEVRAEPILGGRATVRAERPEVGEGGEGGEDDPPAGGEYESSVGERVELNAVSADGWRFLHWGDGSTEEYREETVTGPCEYVAQFVLELEVVADPIHAGEAAINTPESGWVMGAEIQLQAVPNEGWRLVQWDGGETRPVRTVRVDGPRRFVAHFERARHRIATGADPSNGGFVEPADVEAALGDGVPLEAVPNPGWRFVEWTDKVSEAKRIVTVVGEATYVARFEPVPEPEGAKTGAGAKTTQEPAVGPRGLEPLGVREGAEEYLHEGTGIVFVLIPADPAGGRSRPLLVGRTEVTNLQYRHFRSSHVSGEFRKTSLDGDDQPAVSVSWKDAEAFCAHWGMRLPSEAEWLHAAASAGVWPPMQAYGNLADLNFAELARRPPRDAMREIDDGHAVSAPAGNFPETGSVAAGSLPIRDLVGNVWEWCADTVEDQYRPVRGGSWTDTPGELQRLKWRNTHPPQWESPSHDPRVRGVHDPTQELRLRIGFRAVMDP